MQLSNFSIGKYEVTQALWEAVMGTNPSEFKKGKNYPVEEVSWEDCNKFIQKLNHVTGKYFRFPTEAEWEFAAKGGSMFNETNSQTDQILFESAWFKDNINNTSHPVGLKKPNIIGLYDMNGNVWEWCADWYSSYSNTLQINPCGPPTGNGRIIRGGSWSFSKQYLRPKFRFYYIPSYRCSCIGLRLAL